MWKHKCRRVLSWFVRAGTETLVILAGAALISGLWYVLFILRPVG